MDCISCPLGNLYRGLFRKPRIQCWTGRLRGPASQCDLYPEELEWLKGAARDIQLARTSEEQLRGEGA